MIVADSSVVAPALIDEGPSGDAATASLNAGGGLLAPHLLDVEVASVVRGLTLARKVTVERAEAALTDFDALPVTRYSHLRLLPRVWQLRANISAYDALYVALAETLGVSLITADARLARAPGIRCDVHVLDGVAN